MAAVTCCCYCPAPDSRVLPIEEWALLVARVAALSPTFTALHPPGARRIDEVS